MPNPTEVAGLAIPANLAEPRSNRTNVAIVCRSWGENSGERAAAVRLVAGCLAVSANVTVVSLGDSLGPRSRTGGRRFDGIFEVLPAAAPLPQPSVASTVRAALAATCGGASDLPEVAARGLISVESPHSFEAIEILDRLAPDVVVLAGLEALKLSEALPVGAARPRVVALPLVGNDALLASAAIELFAELADTVGAFSASEERLLTESVGRRRPGAIRRLHISLPVNWGAAQSGMAGMASFGRYLLVISAWPPDDKSAGVLTHHDLIREAAGDVSVAEVRHGRWLVTDADRRYEVMWPPSRMNLWRLMAGAMATIDLRTGGPIGREAIESMMFSTPVIVPAHTVAAEHAATSNGGLWFEAPGEMLDQAAYVTAHETERVALGLAGKEWAENTHGDTEKFVSDVESAVLGQTR